MASSEVLDASCGAGTSGCCIGRTEETASSLGIGGGVRERVGGVEVVSQGRGISAAGCWAEFGGSGVVVVMAVETVSGAGGATVLEPVKSASPAFIVVAVGLLLSSSYFTPSRAQ
jgi:hypothetical protein